MPQRTALVLLHDGVEEMEAVAPIDILRRGGIAVTVAAAGDSTCITGRSNLQLKAETTLGAVGTTRYDLLVLVGGPGVAALRTLPQVRACIAAHSEAGCLIGAICAAPLLLLDAGLLGTAKARKDGKLCDTDAGSSRACAADANGATVAQAAPPAYTAHPSTMAELPAADTANAVVVANYTTASGTRGGVITSQGAGTATAFALSLLEHLIGGEAGKTVATEVARAICLGTPQ